MLHRMYIRHTIVHSNIIAAVSKYCRSPLIVEATLERSTSTYTSSDHDGKQSLMASSIPLRPGMEQIQPREPTADHCKTQVHRWKNLSNASKNSERRMQWTDQKSLYHSGCKRCRDVKMSTNTKCTNLKPSPLKVSNTFLFYLLSPIIISILIIMRAKLGMHNTVMKNTFPCTAPLSLKTPIHSPDLRKFNTP